MTLCLRNTFTKTEEPFVPQDPIGRDVLMYSCGPTVYSYAHIGNFRSFLMADLLRRVLTRRGYRVRHVMNITDVGHMTQDHLADATGEDKLAKAARELGWDPYQVARHFEQAFAGDARALRLANYKADEAEDPSLHPRATSFIAEMLALIQSLIDSDHAYVDTRGQVYFEIAKFSDYGRLSGKQLEELEAGARVEVREEKRDPRDFALWKVDPKHLMQWDPHSETGWRAEEYRRLRSLLPKGVDPRVRSGFPGWHIECSAMIGACLGPLIDIHTGGEDNVFPHHECENAQSCAGLGVAVPELEVTYGKSFARYWVHGRHLLVDNRKMSKRDGTFYTVRDLLAPDESGRSDLIEPLQASGFADARVPAAVLRYALLSSPYAQPMNFTFDLLTQARVNVERLQGRYERLRELVVPSLSDSEPSEWVNACVERCRQRFDTALDHNLDVVAAFSAVSEFVSELNAQELASSDALLALRFIEELDEVLDVLDRRIRSGILDKSELERFSDPDFLREFSARTAGWRSHVERSALHSALERGQIPEAETLFAITELDADVTALALGARHVWKKEREYQKADQLRRQLQSLRATIEDTPTGVRWRLP